MAGAQGPAQNAALGRATTPSFRLRNSSLNSIRLRRIFDLFDRNGDGEITVAELGQALGRLGLEADGEEVQKTVATFAKPGRAGLEYEDFEALHRGLGEALFGDLGGEEDESGGEEAELHEAFTVFDEDGDGFISAAELQTVLRKLGLAEGGDMVRVRAMICAVDDNRDGQVDFSEFKHMMRRIAVNSS